MNTANEIYPTAPAATRSYSNIPADLQEWAQWVCWRYEMVDGRKTKVPYTADGARRANTANPQTWASFADAVAGSAQMDGIGFVFTANDPFTGIDLDDKEDKPASAEQRAQYQALIEGFDTYTERSPGGKGYHLIVRGSVGEGRKRRELIEAYSEGRYFTFTGDVVRAVPIAERPELLAKFVAQLRNTPTRVEANESASDDKALEGLVCDDARIKALWDGQWNAQGYPSQSEADCALLRALAAVSHNDAQVLRVFRRSALGQRDKAQHGDYLARTLRSVRAKEPSEVWLEAARRTAARIERQPATRADGTRASKVVAVTVEELLARNLPPREMLLDPWLTTQSLSMIHAWRGVGKTHVALGIAHALASGDAFLNWIAERPVPVLYIDGEMPGKALQSRLNAIFATAGKPSAPDMLRIITPDLQPDGYVPDLATREGQAAIEEQMGDARVVIVDNISCLVRSGGKENDAESWGSVATWALRQRTRQRAVVFMHHSGKNGQQRGTSKREDLLDTVILLRRPTDYEPEQGARFEINFEKGRDVRGDSVTAIEAWLQTAPGGRQTWAIKDATSALSDRILELEKLGMSQAEIAIELGCNKSTVFRIFKKAGLNKTRRAPHAPTT